MLGVFHTNKELQDNSSPKIISIISVSFKSKVVIISFTKLLIIRYHYYRQVRWNILVKFKLLALTIVLVTVALLTQFYVSISKYKNDKIAYVFDTARQSSISTSLMVNADLSSAVDKVKLVFRRSLTSDYKMSKTVKNHVARQKNIKGMYLFKKDYSGNYQLTSEVVSKKNKIENSLLEKIAIAAEGKSISMGRAPNSEQSWILTLPVAKKSGQTIVTIVEIVNSNFVESFFSPKLQNYYLLDSNNNILFQPINAPHEIPDALLKNIVASSSAEASSSSYVRSVETKSGSFLTASSLVSLGGFRVLSVIPESVALEALRVISIKTGLLVVFLLGISIIVSVLGANGLTKNLSKLYQAVNRIIAGELNTKVDIRSKDEVGVLAQGFNLMTGKIQELLLETAEKTRMEGELKTAQTVQQTLFPENHYVGNNFEIFGFYEPASECGGDWYNYTVLKDKAYFWIGDATGHGVPAALITSAAKSASTVIQTINGLSTAQIMSLLNDAVAETSGGSVLMTFFVGCLDFKTGKFSYANASHEAPYLFSPEEKYKRKHIQPILGEPGSRLGQDLGSKYIEQEITLQPGDRLVFYTDGLPEVTDKTGAQWGEGKFLRALVKSFNEESEIKNITEHLLKEAYDFRGDEILHDDVTFFTIKYTGA